MGNNLLKEKEYNIIIEGYYKSGKTSILRKLDRGEIVPNPSEYIEVLDESVTFKYFNLKALNTGVRSASRVERNAYWRSSSAMVFVIDSSKPEWLQDVKFMIQAMYSNELVTDKVALILANKQDLPDALSVDEISKEIEFEKLKQKYCKLIGTSAITGEGLTEAVNWMEQALKEKEEAELMEKQAKAAKSLLGRSKHCLRKALGGLQKVFVS